MMSRMWYRDLKGSPQCLPYGSKRSNMQQMATSWDTRQDSQHEACHGKKEQTTKRHLQQLEVKTHDRQTHVCKLKKALYELRRNPWDNTYMRSLKITYSDEYLKPSYKVEHKILQRMTSSQMGARRTFDKVQDRGSWYPVTLDGYIEYQQQKKLFVTPVHNVSMHRVRKIEGEWCSTSEGVTAEDPEV